MTREGFKGRAKLCANHDNAWRGAGHEEGGTRVPMGEQEKKGIWMHEVGRNTLVQTGEGLRPAPTEYEKERLATAGGSRTAPTGLV